MAVGGSTTAPSWIQALESKYWNMCLFLYMCGRAQWWARSEDGNSNSHCDPASPSTTAIPEPHLKEGCDLVDDPSSLPSVHWFHPTRALLSSCTGLASLTLTLPPILFPLKEATVDPCGSSQWVYFKGMLAFLVLIPPLQYGGLPHSVYQLKQVKVIEDLGSKLYIRCHGKCTKQ